MPTSTYQFASWLEDFTTKLVVAGEVSAHIEPRRAMSTPSQLHSDITFTSKTNAQKHLYHVSYCHFFRGSTWSQSVHSFSHGPGVVSVHQAAQGHPVSTLLRVSLWVCCNSPRTLRRGLDLRSSHQTDDMVYEFLQTTVCHCTPLSSPWALIMVSCRPQVSPKRLQGTQQH